jgi:hypothetical protein
VVAQTFVLAGLDVAVCLWQPAMQYMLCLFAPKGHLEVEAREIGLACRLPSTLVPDLTPTRRTFGEISFKSWSHLPSGCGVAIVRWLNAQATQGVDALGAGNRKSNNLIVRKL